MIKIAHMYPDLMNLYGDRGNLICLKKRIEWFGYPCEIKNIYLGEKINFQDIDMIFMGGGSDREQNLVYQDLIKRSTELLENIEDGFPILCICGAYQLLGNSYLAHNGELMKGLGLFDFTTIGKKDRLIGNILLESNLEGKKISVVGFENHGGRTYLADERLKPFGKVIKGFGNNGEDQSEGMIYKNLIATYLHGPLLPKNPDLADFFIETIFSRKSIKKINKIDDTIERFAHTQIKEKIMLK